VVNIISMKEIWRDIPGYEGLYQVSNLGKVRSFKNNKWGLSDKPKLLKPITIKGDKYNRVSLNGKRFLIHQIVAMAFLSHFPSGHKIVVDHIDNNPLNNNVNNLQLINMRLNSSKDKINKTSKYTGVCYFSRGKKNWKMSIMIDGKLKQNYFDSEEKAHDAYKKELKNLELR
jgi:hypothetical protein